MAIRRYGRITSSNQTESEFDKLPWWQRLLIIVGILVVVVIIGLLIKRWQKVRK